MLSWTFHKTAGTSVQSRKKKKRNSADTACMSARPPMPARRHASMRELALVGSQLRRLLEELARE